MLFDPRRREDCHLLEIAFLFAREGKKTVKLPVGIDGQTFPLREQKKSSLSRPFQRPRSLKTKTESRGPQSNPINDEPAGFRTAIGLQNRLDRNSAQSTKWAAVSQSPN